MSATADQALNTCWIAASAGALPPTCANTLPSSEVSDMSKPPVDGSSKVLSGIKRQVITPPVVPTRLLPQRHRPWVTPR